MMVKMIDPQPTERIGDLAAGTAGFLVHAYQHILEGHTPKETIDYNGDGIPHHLTGELLNGDQRKFLQTKALRGYDNDSGMTILRIGSMNLMLHGIESPRFFYADTLSKGFDAEREFDVVLMNPPFKGAVNADDINDNLPHNTTKSELLFLHLILRSLDMGGRVAVIVPDGVLFGSSRAHVEARRKIIEENRLDGVVSMPSGVFKPYAGVSTAVLLFTRGGQTKDIWFYDMAHDGLSLDDKRVAVQENDIPDILECWKKRSDKSFVTTRNSRIAELRALLKPLKDERLKLHEEINRLRFESVLDGNPDLGNEKSPVSLLADGESRLAKVDSQIAAPQSELDRLTRQFWVTKEQVKANKYDLSASRYRQTGADATYHEKPSVTLERLSRLEQVITNEINELSKHLK